ncbi:MAG: LptA/OstA family protein [Candidatus Tenebribacter davisii]|jgi:hypothetical protein|nr:LptA/OstA family protein [Candidatus Tenebribacter davisii]
MKKKLTGNPFTILFLYFAITLLSNLYAEEELRPYKLINADKLIINKINNEYITNLYGNVHFFYGETEFFSDRADIFELQKIVRMQGNVKVYEDTLSLLADNVDYFRKKERLFLYGNVLATEAHIDSTIRTFEAEEVEYLRNSREFFAKKDVITYDERENMHGTCGELTYFLNDGYGYLMKEPMLSVSNKDTLSISAEKIEYFKNYKKVVATFNVRTFSKDFVMSSDFLLYFADEEKAVYLGEPEFTSDFSDASALEFRIFFEEQKIKKAILQDSCYVQFSDSKNGIKKNWAVGDQMEFDFIMGDITSCEAFGNVRSYFENDGEEIEDSSANNSVGEYLILKMGEKNKIKRISLKENAHGIYKFMHKNW